MARLCVIASLYPPYTRGGAETVVSRVVDGLVAAGHQVDVITLGEQPATEVVDGATIHRIAPWNIFSFINIQKQPILKRVIWHCIDMVNVSSARQVKALLKTIQPDAVLTHNLKGLSYLIPGVIRRLGLRHIHTIHDVQLSRPSGLLFFGHEKPFVVIDSLYEQLCRWLFGSPAVIISPSRWLLDYYVSRGFFPHSERIILSNPVTLHKVQGASSRDNQSVTKLLFVGQLERSKGILLLLDALRAVRFVTWQLTVVGDGSLRDELTQAAVRDSRIVLAGKRPHDELPQWYRQADLTIVPSLVYENSPTVIFESLAANVPVIAADIGGVAEIIRDGHNGFTFAPGSQEGLTAIIEHCISHPELLTRLQQHCFVSIRHLTLPHYIQTLSGYLSTKN